VNRLGFMSTPLRGDGLYPFLEEISGLSSGERRSPSYYRSCVLSNGKCHRGILVPTYVNKTTGRLSFCAKATMGAVARSVAARTSLRFIAPEQKIRATVKVIGGPVYTAKEIERLDYGPKPR
jgi:hypothetical protein